jgi:hypothetical protein
MDDGMAFYGVAEIKIPGQERVETGEISIARPVLYQNHPNPFNPITEISLSLPASSQVTLEVYNIAGQRIGVLFEGQLEAGLHSFTWDGSKSASGLYLFRLKTDEFAETRKMLLLK